MKKRIFFALIMGLITTTLISFVLVVVNVGFSSNFFSIWLSSWLLSYIIAVVAMLVIAPRVQSFVELLLNERNLATQRGREHSLRTTHMGNGIRNNKQKEIFMSQENSNNAEAAVKTEKAIFSSGCFWGTEFYFQRAEGVNSTSVGYTGGSTENPTYQQVSTGRTGHAEAIEIIYDPTKTSYEDMVKLFYETHDQSQRDGQGPDIGTQYRSGIFYANEEQKAIAEKLTEQLKSKGYEVATEITKAGPFYKAEKYHQNYYGKNGQNPYCHRYIKKF